jgi:hypothetical protein
MNCAVHGLVILFPSNSSFYFPFPASTPSSRDYSFHRTQPGLTQLAQLQISAEMPFIPCRGEECTHPCPSLTPSLERTCVTPRNLQADITDNLVPQRLTRSDVNYAAWVSLPMPSRCCCKTCSFIVVLRTSKFSQCSVVKGDCCEPYPKLVGLGPEMESHMIRTFPVTNRTFSEH